MRLMIITITKDGFQLFVTVKTVSDAHSHITNRISLAPFISLPQGRVHSFVIIATEKNGTTHIVRTDEQGRMINYADAAKFQELYRLEKEGA